jgi:uncharacterized protein YecT (DUF1311 family)
MPLTRTFEGSLPRPMGSGIATQRLWIQYRDANCTAERDLYDGGTAASPAYLACLEAMTRARTRELAVTYAVKLK